MCIVVTRTPIAREIANCCQIEIDTAKQLYLPAISDEVRYTDYLDISSIIRLAHENGCIAVLAHPGWIRPYNVSDEIRETDLWKAIVELARVGLDGIEVFHRLNSDAQRKAMLSIAQYLNLIPTGGSDHHGKPRCVFGTNGTPNDSYKRMMEKLR